MKSRPSLAVVLLAACLPFVAPAIVVAQDTGRAWIEESNRHAGILLDVYAKHIPEQAASLGVDGLDERITQYTPGYDERFEADLLAAVTRLEAERAKATDPRVRQDLDIMIQSARDVAGSSALSRRLMLPNIDVPQQLFSSFSALLDPRIPKERYPAALKRLAGYVGSAPGTIPATELAKARSTERFATRGPDWPMEGRGRAVARQHAPLRRGHARIVQEERSHGLGARLRQAREADRRLRRVAPRGTAASRAARTTACRRRSTPTTCTTSASRTIRAR